MPIMIKNALKGVLYLENNIYEGNHPAYSTPVY